MLTSRLFPNVFKKFQSLLSLNQKMGQVLDKTTEMELQNKICHLYSISNLISSQISQLQKPFIQQFLKQFPRKDQRVKSSQVKKQLNEFYFDQKTYKFVLKSTYNIQKPIKQIPLINNLNQINKKIDQLSQKKFEQVDVVICINPCQNQKIDSPLKRKTLYFHELKDIDKYVIASKDYNMPPFIKELNKKKLQYEVLDRNNPLGVPTTMPPLFIQIQLQNQTYFKVKYYLGEIVLVQVRKIKKKLNKQNNLVEYEKTKIKISGMRIPRTAQQTIFKNLFQDILSLDREKILNYHKLAYVAGRIEKIEKMIDIHELMWSQVAIKN